MQPFLREPTLNPLKFRSTPSPLILATNLKELPPKWLVTHGIIVSNFWQQFCYFLSSMMPRRSPSSCHRWGQVVVFNMRLFYARHKSGRRALGGMRRTSETKLRSGSADINWWRTTATTWPGKLRGCQTRRIACKRRWMQLLLVDVHNRCPYFSGWSCEPSAHRPESKAGFTQGAHRLN